ncbi:hypothetical protein [Pseudonocardia alni]|nr:hypothetical protein [Pseudonocardia alni]
MVARCTSGPTHTDLVSGIVADNHGTQHALEAARHQRGGEVTVDLSGEV